MYYQNLMHDLLRPALFLLGGVSGNVNSLLPVVFDAVPNEAAMDNIYSNGLYIHASLTGMGYGGVFCIGYGNAQEPKFTQLDVTSTRIRVRSNTGSGWTSWNVIATY